MDSDNVSIKEDSNLDDNVSALSSQNKLGISNEVSISETNIVNSQNDNLGNSSSDSVLSSSNSDENLKASAEAKTNTLSSSNSVSNNLGNTSSKVPVNLTVTKAVADKSSTIFKVQLTDSSTGKVLTDSKVILILDGKTFFNVTGEDGIAQFSTKSLETGNYSVILKYAGTLSRYEAALLTEEVYVFKKIYANMTVTSAIADKSSTIFKVKLTDSSTGNALTNSKVVMILDGKTFFDVTDADGMVMFTTKSLATGNYNVILKYAGTLSRYDSVILNKKVYVFKKIPAKLSVAGTTYNKSNTNFKVTVKDSQTNNAINGYKVLLIVNKKTYMGITNKNGIATIVADPLDPGTYDAVLKFSGTISRYEATVVSQKVEVSKIKVSLTAGHLMTKYKARSFYYSAAVKDNDGNILKNVKVTFTTNGKSYTAKTDENGIAKVAINLGVGFFAVNSVVSDKIYQSSTVTKYILVNGTKFIASDLLASTGQDIYYSLKVVDGRDNPLKNHKVAFKIGSKSFYGTSNSAGVIKVNLGKLSVGNYKLEYQYAFSSGSSKISVVNKVSLNELIAASKTVKSYIEGNEKLPSSVKIGDKTYTTAQYLYLASQAILNLKKGDKSGVLVKPMANPKSPVKASNLGDLYDYYTTARRVVNHGDSYNSMPGYAISNVGNIGYEGLVYAFSRVIVFYGSYSMMPNYVTIKTLNTPYDSSVDSRNTISNLAAYLAASTNCQVNNAQIKALAAKLTSGLTNDKAKATAIYNYVRDSISYSFYYDTKHGAVGTLNAKSGNCVDQAHLLVALYRASNLPARYVHGTCTFSSGTYGHVWTQVLVNNVWTVGDPTSNRNSFGKVVNWNTNSYSLKGYYASIGF